MTSATILAIDGRRDDLLALERLLADHLANCRVVTAATADEGLLLVQHTRFDLGLLRVGAPGMHGADICRRIKRESPQPFPIFLMTSDPADAQVAAEGLKAGADHLVSRPLDGVELLTAIKMALRLKDAEDKLRAANRRLRQVRRQLREGREEHRELVAMVSDAVIVFDTRSQEILDVNEAACRIYGYTREEFLALSPSDLLAEPQSSPANPGKPAAPGGKEAAWQHHRRKDGTVFPAEISGGVFKVGGRVCGCGVFRDVSVRQRAEEEKRRIEERLRQAQKMEAIGALAGGIAHDFNNILTALLGYTAMAMEGSPESSPIRPDLKEVWKAGNRAKELVQQILTFSRQAEEERQPVEVGAIIREALRLLRASLPPTIEIVQKIDPHCGKVLADPSQIHQLIMNLCTNGAHAMAGEGGALEVVLDKTRVRKAFARAHPPLRTGAHMRLTVRDTGTGMDPATLERIFEPFFTTKPVGQGTGMGLATVHGIVARLRGAIAVSSRVGKGSCFQVYLPVHKTAPKRRPPRSAQAVRGSEHILFVDDEEAIARLAERTFQRLGYRVTIAGSGPEALKHLQARPDEFDLVITDHQMPRMTGSQLAEKIREIRPDLPMVLTTGFTETITAETARRLGFADFVMKPVVARGLGRIIRRVLDRPKAPSRSASPRRQDA